MHDEKAASLAFRDLVTAAKGVERAADFMGVSRSAVSNYQSLDQYVHRLPTIVQSIRLVRATGCTSFGDFINSYAVPEPVEDEPMLLALRAQQRLGRMAEAIEAAERDGVWDYAEARHGYDVALKLERAAQKAKQRFVQMIAKHNVVGA